MSTMAATSHVRSATATERAVVTARKKVAVRGNVLRTATERTSEFILGIKC